jgi:hypothetical protein
LLLCDIAPITGIFQVYCMTRIPEEPDALQVSIMSGK